MADVLQQNILTRKYFSTSYCLCMGTARLLARVHDFQNRSLMEELQKESCICGYHIYSSILDAEIGEQVQVVGSSPIMNVNDCCRCS